MEKTSYLEKLKVKWEIDSNFQILLICIVFAITGSASVQIAAPILEYVGVTSEMNPWLYWPLRLILIFPFYQVLLIIVGTVFGQFRFFWNLEKKMFSRFGGKKKQA